MTARAGARPSSLLALTQPSRCLNTWSMNAEENSLHDSVLRDTTQEGVTAHPLGPGSQM